MVDILLATYNGADYIEAQIYSIISQTYKNWRLLIHDDGSSDNTLDLIRKIAVKESRICIIEDGVKLGSAGKNFLHLVAYADSDYVMFCDQDDIWFDNKISLMLDVISKQSQAIPVVLYSNSYVWKPNVGVLGVATLTYPSTLKELLFLNSGIQGCVAIFNRKVVDLLTIWNGDVSMHDHILNLIGVAIGKTLYLHVPLMLYRQHDKNVTGGTRTKLINKTLLVQHKKNPVIDRVHYNAVLSFYRIYHNLINQRNLEIFEIFFRLPDMNPIKRVWTIFYNRFKIYSSTLFLIVKIMIRPYIK